MPKKSHRAVHGKSKSRKGQRGASTSARQQSAIPVSRQASAPAFKPPQPPGTTPPITSQVISQRRHVARELKRSGIIGGAMFVILMILFFLLPHMLP